MCDQTPTADGSIPSDGPGHVPAMNRCLEAVSSLIKMPDDAVLRGALGTLACMCAHAGTAGRV